MCSGPFTIPRRSLARAPTSARHTAPRFSSTHRCRKLPPRNPCPFYLQVENLSAPLPRKLPPPARSIAPKNTTRNICKNAARHPVTSDGHHFKLIFTTRPSPWNEPMETTPEPIKEILDELFSLLESLETQSLALTQFLKDQGIATDAKLVPYLDRAGNASSVKWRAARARMHYLLSPVAKQTDDQAKDKNKKSEQSQAEKQATEKQPTEKPSTAQDRPASPDVTKDT